MQKESRLEKLIKEIERVKSNLYSLVEEKQWNLLDMEVIRLSELLDELLLDYHNTKK